MLAGCPTAQHSTAQRSTARHHMTQHTPRLIAIGQQQPPTLDTGGQADSAWRDRRRLRLRCGERPGPSQRPEGRGPPHHARAKLSPWFFKGRERMRLPVAAAMALTSAGASGACAGSPTPPQKPPVQAMTDCTLGISLSRIIR